MAKQKLGLVLGSGAARGWAHVGVLQGLKEIGVEPDVIAGCSVGALVGGAHLIGALDELEKWARTLKPLSALGQFSFKVQKGGFIDAAAAFEAFREFDRKIEDLPVRFGAIATDLGTGDEIEITAGSVVDAARASSAIPVVFHAVPLKNRWLVDGALTNPTPVTLARRLGADKIISVDLNAVPKVLERFDPPPPGPPAIVESRPASGDATLSGAINKLIEDTQIAITRQFELAKAKSKAAPQLFETAYAAADIFQMHLARARAELDPPDILLRPDMRDAMPTAFDRADEFIAVGREALLARRDDIFALLNNSNEEKTS